MLLKGAGNFLDALVLASTKVNYADCISASELKGLRTYCRGSMGKAPRSTLN
jgi:hypothetical protein